MSSRTPPPTTDEWLESQLFALKTWVEELRVSDPVRFRHEVARIDSHRNWLAGQILHLKNPSAHPAPPL
jgi:hypothetical protein